MSAREWLRETAGPVITLLLTAILIGGCVGFAARANADEVAVYTTWKAANICNWLSQHPQASAVAPLFKAIQDDTGFDVEDTARVLVTAVRSTCPESLPVLQRFVDLNAPAAPVVAR